MKPTYLLEIYEEDDTTLLFDVSTDPAHARPYLKVPDSFPEQEIDFAKGRASIGQVNLGIVDVRTVATDQDTGYITSQLADDDGYPQLGGHRAIFYEDRGSGNEKVLDGLVRRVKLLETLVTFQLELRDIRERERKTKAFQTTDTATVLPRGVLDGYGKLPNGEWLIPPTEPLGAVYKEADANRGHFNLSEHWDEDKPDPALIVTPAQREAVESISQLTDRSDFTAVYDRVKVLWRDAAAGGAYTEITDIAQVGFQVLGFDTSRLAVFREGRYLGRIPIGEPVRGFLRIMVNNYISGASLPADEQDVEIIVQYSGPTTPDYPYHLDDLTVGELIRNADRGDYSTDEEGNVLDPRIRYNEAALLDLTTPVRARIPEPVDDLREFLEKEAYPIARAAPTLNQDGEIAPVTYELPDVGTSLVTLNDSNCRVEAGWSHGTEDAVNLVKVTYHRDFLLSPHDDPFGERGAGDGIVSREITVEHRVAESIALLGEQELKIESGLLRAIGTSDGEPITGDVSDETGAQVAALVTRMATDRFSLGGQYFPALAKRSDPDVEALRNGGWALLATSWTPEYSTGKRGANRLAQVLGRRNLDANWVQLSLIDAGPDNVPLGQPTLGAVTANDDGSVSVPVDAVPTGGEARVDFAINDTEPVQGSELWTFLGRTDQVETLDSPPVPADETVWVRSRGEGIGRRPSAWTNAVTVTAPSTPRVRDVRITIATDGTPTIEWTPNSVAAGVRLHYAIHDPSLDPPLTNTVDVDATAGSHELSGETVALEEQISADVEPFDGFSGGSVSGTAGPKVSVSRTRGRSGAEAEDAPVPSLVFTSSNAFRQSFKVEAEAGASGDDPEEYRWKLDDEDGEVTAWSAWTALTAAGDSWESSEITVQRGDRVARYVRAQVRDTEGRESEVVERAVPSLKQWLADLHGGHIGSWERDEVDIIAGDTRDDSGQSVKAPPGGVMDDAGLEQILDTELRRLHAELGSDVSAETSGRLVDTIDDEAHDARRHGPAMGSEGPLDVATQEGETRDDSGDPILTRPGGLYDEEGLVRAVTADGKLDQLSYGDGTPVEDLEPGEAGANVTENRTSADTSAVDGEDAENIHDGSDRARSGLESDGKALQSDVLQDDGVARRNIAKGHHAGAGLTDGDVVTFPTSFQSPPLVLLRGGKSYSSSLGNVDQAREVVAQGLTAAGFTLRAKVIERGASTERTDSFGAGTISATGAGNAIEANINPAGASGDRYKVAYAVTVDASGGSLTSRLTLVIETNDGSGWTERLSVEYTQEAGSSKTWSGEEKTIIVVLDTDDDVRTYAKAFSGDGTFSIDPADVVYTTSADNEVSATGLSLGDIPPYPVSYDAWAVAD